MKKKFLILTALAAAIFLLSQEAKAQWTDPYSTYRTNDLIRRTPKKNASANRGKSSKKVFRRKTRRVKKLRQN